MGKTKTNFRLKHRRRKQERIMMRENMHELVSVPSIAPPNLFIITRLPPFLNT